MVYLVALEALLDVHNDVILPVAVTRSAELGDRNHENRF
jgi:hypothetical protein